MVTAREFATQAVYEMTKAGVPDAAFEVRCLLEDFAGMPHGALPDERPLSQEMQLKLQTAVAERINGRPLQYILGEWDFLSLRLKVGEGVLIPRQDTELLCETAAELVKDLSDAHLLDLCAGSGCVGLGICSLAPKTKVTAVEKSETAFGYLQKNMARYPHLQVQAVQGDIFADDVTGTFDGIVSNPPYIPTKDLASLMPEVKNEPEMALDGGEDGLLFYRCILTRWLPKIKPGGFLAVEIGYDQDEQVNDLFEKYGLQHCRVLYDLGGNPRVVLGFCPKIEK